MANAPPFKNEGHEWSDKRTYNSSKVYSSFNTAGRSALPMAPRKLLSAYETAAPPPTQYDVKFPEKHKSGFIPKAKRVTTEGGSSSPGPGYYSSAEPGAPFTGYQGYTEASQPKRGGFVPPSLKRAVHIPKMARDTTPLTFGSPGEPGQVNNGRVLRTGVPGPQHYNVEPAKRVVGGIVTKAPRWKEAPSANIPGPGQYTNVFPTARGSAGGPKFSSSRRETQSDHRNLHEETKNPGPGYYNPSFTHPGRAFDPFVRYPVTFNVTADELAR
eukprot:TRINITY_DN1908_c5_g1_i1.p1 TRINITY_DN1908_c5_g1~~TRINITY_DN1908_c5_g1_i1.p1  ORF type:complete len:271 (+),score=23.60 TRINITY_DN1908_c5_g1_i1:42-854(+)